MVSGCWEGRDLNIHGSWRRQVDGIRQQKQVHQEAKETKSLRPFTFRPRVMALLGVTSEPPRREREARL